MDNRVQRPLVAGAEPGANQRAEQAKRQRGEQRARCNRNAVRDVVGSGASIPLGLGDAVPDLGFHANNAAGRLVARHASFGRDQRNKPGAVSIIEVAAIQAIADHQGDFTLQLFAGHRRNVIAGAEAEAHTINQRRTAHFRHHRFGVIGQAGRHRADALTGHADRAAKRLGEEPGAEQQGDRPGGQAVQFAIEVRVSARQARGDIATERHAEHVVHDLPKASALAEAAHIAGIGRHRVDGASAKRRTEQAQQYRRGDGDCCAGEDGTPGNPAMRRRVVGDGCSRVGVNDRARVDGAVTGADRLTRTGGGGSKGSGRHGLSYTYV